MQYLLLIYGDEKHFEKLPSSERDNTLAEYHAFTNSIAQSGHLRGGNELEFAKNAKTVRVREGKPIISDGPFAETKEQLGGYYLVEAKDIDEALAIGARIPSARWGSIEVRPVIPHDIPLIRSTG